VRFGLPQRFRLVTSILWILRIVVVVLVLAGAWATLSKGVLEPDDWRDLIIYGIAQGSVYALIALGYTLVYGVLFMINFAHGDVFMSGAMTAFFVARTFGQSGFLNQNPVVALAIIFAVSMLTSMIVAVVLERIAYRPLRRAPRLVPLITAIGASLFISNSVRGLYGERVQPYPQVDVLAGRVDLFGVPILKTQLMVIGAAVFLMVVLVYFVERTRTGRAMRAVSEDKDVAALMGINVDRIIVTTFAIGGLLAGAAGILYALIYGQVDWFMGFLPGIKAFTAAVLGGIGNIGGAMVGGLTLGILENVGPPLLLSGAGVPSVNQLRDVIAFTVLVLVLIFRPNGILGSNEPGR
jgi:branched-chain amino acid transport system permease protein